MLTPQLLLTLLIIAVIVLAWFASEFWEPRWLRVALGFFALIVVGGAAWLSASVLQRFNYNTWYGVAGSDLIDTAILNIEAGNTDKLLVELKRLRSEFQPTYENRAHYDEQIEQFIARMNAELPVSD